MYSFVNICDEENSKELKVCDAIFPEKSSTLSVNTFSLAGQYQSKLKGKEGLQFEIFFLLQLL